MILFTGGVVSNRFKNIKDTFARNFRALKESKRSGAGTDNFYKPKWHMFDRLMFLKKTCIQGESESNIPSIQLKATTTSNSQLSQNSEFSYNKENDIPNTQDTSPLNIYYDKALQVNYFSK